LLWLVTLLAGLSLLLCLLIAVGIGAHSLSGFLTRFVRAPGLLLVVSGFLAGTTHALRILLIHGDTALALFVIGVEAQFARFVSLCVGLLALFAWLPAGLRLLLAFLFLPQLFEVLQGLLHGLEVVLHEAFRHTLQILGGTVKFLG
jgi:hypothetical protein